MVSSFRLNRLATSTVRADPRYVEVVIRHQRQVVSTTHDGIEARPAPEARNVPTTYQTVQ